MATLKMIDDPEIIEESANLIFEEEGEEFSPEYVRKHNDSLKPRKDKLGTFALKYRKKGWLSLVGIVLFSILNTGAVIFLDEPSPFMIFIAVVALVLRWVCGVGIFLWVIVWFAYWLSPLQCCTFCNALYAREVVFEKKVPGTSVRGVEGRTVSHKIKNNDGKVTGSIEEEVSVDVVRANYYTVYQCKKCKKMKVEIIRKQFDA